MNIKKRQFGVIWFVELWERYAFYGFQSLFVLFMASEHISEEKTYMIFGIFAALLYLTPTIGGFIADKYIGIKRSLVTGGVILFIGYAILSLSTSLNMILWSLSFIIVGNGLFKPAPTALISRVFGNNANSSHSAFTLYYMGVNIGSFLGIAITPIVAKYTAFTIAFSISVVGMIAALANYWIRYDLLRDVKGEMDSQPLDFKLCGVIIIVSLVQLIICYTLFHAQDISFYLILGLCVLLFVYMLLDAINMKDPQQRIMQIIGIILVAEAIAYFVIYNQMFSTLIMFADHNMRLTLLGINVSPASYAALDSVWLVIISPILAFVYTKLHKQKLFVIPYKYALGTMLSGVAFVVLYFICIMTAVDGEISGNWMILFYFFAAFAELLVAALGFSLIALYFRKEIVTLGMGFFMLALACGGALAGKLGQYVAMPEAGLPKLESIAIYQNFFIWLGIICFALGLVYVLLTIYMQRFVAKRGFSLK